MTSSLRSPWLPYAKLRPDARVRLMCFPGAGGAATLYTDWLYPLEKEGVDLLAVELPGRGARIGEATIDDFEHVLAPMVEILEGASDVPFAFVGYCLGGEVAMRLAQRLQEQGGPLPEHIALVATPSPQHDDDDLRTLRSDVSVEVLLERARREFPISRQAVFSDDDYMRAFIRTARADVRMKQKANVLVPTALPVPMAHLFAHGDPLTPLEETGDWAPFTASKFRTVNLGHDDHYFLFSPDRGPAQTVLEELRQDLSHL